MPSILLDTLVDYLGLQSNSGSDSDSDSDIDVAQSNTPFSIPALVCLRRILYGVGPYVPARRPGLEQDVVRVIFSAPTSMFATELGVLGTTPEFLDWLASNGGRLPCVEHLRIWGSHGQPAASSSSASSSEPESAVTSASSEASESSESSGPSPPAATAARSAAELFLDEDDAAHVAARNASVTRFEAALVGLIATGLPRLRKIAIYFEIGNAILSALATHSPHLTDIMVSGFGAWFNDAGVSQLAASCHNLQVVELSGNDQRITDAAVESLCEHCPRLRELDLGSNAITRRALHVIAASLHDTLQSLTLTLCGSYASVDLVDDDAVDAIASNCTYLKNIDVAYCKQVTDKALVSIGEHSVNLTRICIAGLAVTDEGMEGLLRGRARPALEQLHASYLTSAQFTAKSVLLLAQCCGATLKELWLSTSRGLHFPAEAVECLAACPLLETLVIGLSGDVGRVLVETIVPKLKKANFVSVAASGVTTPVTDDVVPALIAADDARRKSAYIRFEGDGVSALSKESLSTIKARLKMIKFVISQSDE